MKASSGEGAALEPVPQLLSADTKTGIQSGRRPFPPESLKGAEKDDLLFHDVAPPSAADVYIPDSSPGEAGDQAADVH